MRISELYTQIDELFDMPCGIQLYAVLRRNEEELLKYINLKGEIEQDDNTSNDLMKGFINAIRSLLNDEDDSSVLKLSTADDRKNAIYYYDLDELPYEMELLKAVSEQPDKVDVFNFQDDKLKEIIGFIVLIGDANRHIAIYKQQYSISLLNRDKYMLTPIPHSNRMKKYEGDILRIDFNCHFFLWNDYIYILDVEKMEKICSFTDIIRKEAEKSIEMIKEIDIVDNVEALSDEIDNMTFVRKLTRIYKDSRVIGKVSNDAIINFAQTHSYFKNNPIKVNDSHNKFILDTKKSKNAFLKLLNDDLLTSELTREEYESLAKNNI